MIMLGLGLYVKFSANEEALLPILNNQSVVNFMLVAGAAIMLWGTYKIVIRGREKAKLNNEKALQ